MSSTVRVAVCRGVAVLATLAAVVTCAAVPAASAVPDPTPVGGGRSDRAPAPSSADLGFADLTRDGSVRTLRHDLVGTLDGQVDFAQATTVAPTGNAAAERPDLVAERDALLLFRPGPGTTDSVRAVTAVVRVGDEVRGTVALAPPRELPRADQSFDSRGTVAWSLQAWSVELPWQWVRPGLGIEFTARTERGELRGTLTRVRDRRPADGVRG